MRTLIFLLLLNSTAFAQQYVAEAPLNAVLRSGFYNIPLTPKATSLLTPDFRNIRIIDEKNVEAPYVIDVEKPRFVNVEFIDYEMEKDQVKGCCTKLILSNDKKNQISNIILEVRNAETTKRATLLGSDDKQTWYTLKENFVLSDLVNTENTSALRILDFPLSDYSFYEIIVNDSTTAPLNISRAGYYNTSTDYGVYVDIQEVSISAVENQKEHRTEVSIEFDTIQFIDKIDLEISGPQFYHRRAVVFDDNMNTIQSVDITSTHKTTIDNSMRSKVLTLFVYNDNNPPLKFDAVYAYQFKRSLTAWLSSEHHYRVAIGCDSMRAPVYDLEYFRDSIPPHPSELNMDMIRNMEKFKKETDPTFFTTKKIVWFAIISVIALLGLMSARMLRDKNLEQ